MAAYYNEILPYASEWLRNLIAAGHLAPGDVDNRPLEEVCADDLKGYTQCHFFAGIGVWSHALRRAGWPDDRPVWTGSCPCQPFSAAGQRKGFEDERHLWPIWYDLIAQCRPPVLLGEQVASALDWFDLVQTDLEASGYAVGASDLCAAGFGGAHIRQRLYFCGELEGLDHAAGARRQWTFDGPEGSARDEARLRLPRSGSDNGGLANEQQQQRGQIGADARGSGEGGGAQGLDQRPVCDSTCGGLAQSNSGQRAGLTNGQGRLSDGTQTGRLEGDGEPEPSIDLCGLADPNDGEHWDGQLQPCGEHRLQPQSGGRLRGGDQGPRPDAAGTDTAAHAPMLGRNPVDWLFCRDGKWRPVEPGTFPLATEITSRVGRLRAYGNALDAETATQFVGAVMEATALLREAEDLV